MTDRPKASCLSGFLYDADGSPRVAVYCSGCTSFYVKNFSSDNDLQAFKSREPFGWVSNCPYDRSYTDHCKRFEAIYAGDAPPAMVTWLESDRPDWPMCPEDFTDGGCHG